MSVRPDISSLTTAKAATPKYSTPETAGTRFITAVVIAGLFLFFLISPDSRHNANA
jgi:hypothetical protein